MFFARVKAGGPNKAYRYAECPVPGGRAVWTRWLNGEGETEHIYAVFHVRGRSRSYPRCQVPGAFQPGVGLLWIRVSPLTLPGVEALARRGVWRVRLDGNVYAVIPLPPSSRRVTLDGVTGVASSRSVIEGLEKAFGDIAFVARAIQGSGDKIAEKIRGIYINDEVEPERLKCPWCGGKDEYYFPWLHTVNHCGNCGAEIILSPIGEEAETAMIRLDAFDESEVKGKYRTVRCEDGEVVAIFLKPR